MKKLFLLLTFSLFAVACSESNIDDPQNNNPIETIKCASNEIIYTTKYGYPIELKVTSGFGGNIVEHTYENGYGKIVFDNDVQTIPHNAFNDCNSITTITLPESVTTFEDGAFSNCSSLTSVYYNGDISTWCKIGFKNTDSTPLCYGAKLYINNTEVTEVTIPSDISVIKDYAFCGCSSLTSITIPESVTLIAWYAFRNCSSLTSVTIGNSVTIFGERAFEGCSSLTSVYYNGDLSDWCNIYFYNYYSNPLFHGAKLYINNTEVTEVTIPSDISKIKDCTFCGCSSLTSITIPYSVTKIGNYAFYKCTSLKEVYCKPTTPPTGGDYMFYSNASGRKIYVPTASVDAYKNAEYWSDYKNDIVGYDF